MAADKRHVKMFGEAVGRYLNNKWDLHIGHQLVLWAGFFSPAF